MSHGPKSLIMTFNETPIVGSPERNFCLQLVERLTNIGRFTQEEFKLFHAIIKWFKEPNKDFWFHLAISYSDEYFTAEYIISNDSECFRIEDIKQEMSDFGSDTYSTFQYLVFGQDSKCEGSLKEFEKSIYELIASINDSGMEIKITLTKLD